MSGLLKKGPTRIREGKVRNAGKRKEVRILLSFKGGKKKRRPLSCAVGRRRGERTEIKTSCGESGSFATSRNSLEKVGNKGKWGSSQNYLVLVEEARIVFFSDKGKSNSSKTFNKRTKRGGFR